MGKRDVFDIGTRIGKEGEEKKSSEEREKENANTHVTFIIIVFAHVIMCQIGMIGLYTVVKY